MHCFSALPQIVAQETAAQSISRMDVKYLPEVMLAFS